MDKGNGNIKDENFKNEEEKIAFSFFYRDYCSDYGNQNFNDLKTYICDSWELNRNKNLYNAYIENAYVWFNLTKFWLDIDWESFRKKHYVGDCDFDEDWSGDISADYYYPGEEDYNTRVSKNNFNYIILTANPIEHYVVSQFIKKLPRFENKKIKRFSTPSESKCEFLKVGNGVSILHIAANSMGSFTQGGSEKTLSELIYKKDRKCRLVTSLGIAYGMDPKEQKLADVLVSSSMISHHTFKRKNDIVQLLEDEYYVTNHKVTNFWSRSDWEKQDKKNPFKTIIGPMLSGGAVLSDSWEKKRIQDACEEAHHQTPKGGEMEGDGMYRVCRRGANPAQDYPCVVIKGICDWGALKNSWSLVAHKEFNEEVVYDGDEIIIDYNGNPVEPNDVIKNSVQALGVKRALLVWTYYLLQTNKKTLTKTVKEKIEKILEELEKEVKIQDDTKAKDTVK